jgi:hypothetical protein
MKRESAIVSDIVGYIKAMTTTSGYSSDIDSDNVFLCRSKMYDEKVAEVIDIITKFKTEDTGTIQIIIFTFEIMVRGQSDNYSSLINRYNDILYCFNSNEAILQAKYGYIVVNPKDEEIEPDFTMQDREEGHIKFDIEVKHSANEKWTVDNTSY